MGFVTSVGASIVAAALFNVAGFVINWWRNRDRPPRTERFWTVRRLCLTAGLMLTVGTLTGPFVVRLGFVITIAAIVMGGEFWTWRRDQALALSAPVPTRKPPEAPKSAKPPASTPVSATSLT